MGVKFKGVTLSAFLFLSGLGLTSASTASDSITVSGVIQGELSVSNIKVLGLRPPDNGVTLGMSFVGNNGTYSLGVPINTPVEIQISGTSTRMSASWKRAYIFTKDTSLNLTIPVGNKLSGQIVDAQGNALPLADVSLVKGKMDPTKISSDGSLWEGEYQIPVTQADSKGIFSLSVYPTKEINRRVSLQIKGYVPAYSWVSTEFFVEGPRDFTVCIPLNFGAEKTLPKNCTEDQSAYDKRILNERTAAAELKAKQEAEQKAAADKVIADAKAVADAKVAADKIVQEAKLEAARILAAAKAAAVKKTTITCVKGKLVKKVTAVKPKCPAGYKKK
jgi:hypothetical protein